MSKELAKMPYSFEELLEKERRLCPPKYRKELEESEIKQGHHRLWPTQLCLKHLIVPLLKEPPAKGIHCALGDKAGLNGPIVSRMFTGKFVEEYERWAEKFKNLFRTLLLHRNIYEYRENGDLKLEDKVVKRMADYFFGDFTERGSYFAINAIDTRTPWRLIEARYEILYVADLVASKGGNAHFFVSSGGSEFAQGKENITTDLSNVTIAAAAAGVNFYLIYPSVRISGQSDAEKSVKRFFDKVSSALEEQDIENYNDYLYGILEDPYCNDKCKKRIKKGIRAMPVNPNDEALPRKRKKIFAGQFLNPTFRYVHWDWQNSVEDDSHLFISRSQDKRPFAFSAEQDEDKIFSKWLKNMRKNKRNYISLEQYEEDPDSLDDR